MLSATPMHITTATLFIDVHKRFLKLFLIAFSTQFKQRAIFDYIYILLTNANDAANSSERRETRSISWDRKNYEQNCTENCATINEV